MPGKAMQPEKKIEASLLENKVVIHKGFEELGERSYGKVIDGRLEISYTEALYLLQKERIAVKKGKTGVAFKSLMSFAMERDKRLHEKYIVYKDLRDRGLVVKTGFKFGCDFRVYKRGIAVKRGPKTPDEHTKWIVYTVPEDYTCSFAELSRAVRLAHSIRARMLWAIVDNENDVTYYEVLRLRP
ncbi:MAG: tRNA-intron lyase [Candidatus Aenigmarchaeota archaeon]|nr:tRNA-intron lyase [Candidatus Aenigmarchaeota archaeon]